MTTPVTVYRRPREVYGLHPFNALKLLAHRARAEAALRGELVYPVSVEIDLSLKCNHACAWCSFDGWRQANWIDFPTPRILSLIDELAACGVQSITLTGGGEPLVHKAAFEVIQRIVDRGMEVGIVTNGWNLKDAVAALVARVATFVRVSLDAGTSETHQRIHAAPMPQFDQILDRLAWVIELARTAHRDRPSPLTVGASFCVFDSNVDEIALAAARLKALGANYLEVRPVYPSTWRGGRQDDAGISDANIDRAQAAIRQARETYDDETFQVIGMVDRFAAVREFRHTDFYSTCRITDLSTVISSDGQIYACCVHRGLPAFAGGSVLDRPFAEVWADRPRRDMAAAIDVAKCPKCRYVGLNSVLAHAIGGDALHANFI